MIIRQLQLHDHTMLAPEKIFTSKKIEFPHPHKPCVIDFGHAVTVCQKTQAPMVKRVRIVPAHHLHIEKLEPASFACLHQLLDRGEIAARKDIPGQPPVHRRPVCTALVWITATPAARQSGPC